MKFVKQIDGKKIEIIFSHNEENRVVQRVFEIYINNKIATFRRLKKLLINKDYPYVLTGVCLLTHIEVDMRRIHEEKINKIVKDYFISEGFSEVES